MDLPAVYILERRHVEETLARAPADDGHEIVTLWLHSVTVPRLRGPDWGGSPVLYPEKNVKV